MAAYTSDLEHWRIRATVFNDHVEEIHILSDTVKGIHARPTTKRWAIDRLLGRGAYGDVRLHTHGKEKRAVKRIELATEGVKLGDQDYIRELKALLEFSKPKYKETARFVDFYGWFSEGFDIFIAMEYVPLGDLEKNLKGLKDGKIRENEARNISHQILTAINIMHLERFVHRDLKPQNVLVVKSAPDWWVKVADFGLSKRLTESTKFCTFAGSQSYMAPEILEYLESCPSQASTGYTNAVDIWALGCIIYRLVAGSVPFTRNKNLIDYCEDKYPFPEERLSGVTSKGCGFIKTLLHSNPHHRPSTLEALKHPWMADEITRKSSIKEDKILHLNERKPNFFTTAPNKPDGLSVPEEQHNYSSSVSDELSQLNFNTISHAGLKSRKDHSQTDELASSIIKSKPARSQSQSSVASSSVTSVYESRSDITHSEEPEDVTVKPLLSIEKPPTSVFTPGDVEQNSNLPPVKYRAVAVEEFTGNLRYPHCGELEYFPFGAEILEVTIYRTKCYGRYKGQGGLFPKSSVIIIDKSNDSIPFDDLLKQYMWRLEAPHVTPQISLSLLKPRGNLALSNPEAISSPQIGKLVDRHGKENITRVNTVPRGGQEKITQPVTSATSKVETGIDAQMPMTAVPAETGEPVSLREEQNFIRHAAISHRWHDTVFKASDSRNSESRKLSTPSSKTSSSRVGEAIRRLEMQTKSKLNVAPHKRHHQIISGDTLPNTRKQKKLAPLNEEKASTSFASQKSNAKTRNNADMENLDLGRDFGMSIIDQKRSLLRGSFLVPASPT